MWTAEQDEQAEGSETENTPLADGASVHPALYTLPAPPTAVQPSDVLRQTRDAASTFATPSHGRPSSSRLAFQAPLPPSAQAAAPAPRLPSNHLGDPLGFLSIHAAGEPIYLGDSVGFSLANMVQAAIRDRSSPTMTTEADPDPTLPIRNLPNGADRLFSCHRPKPTTAPAGMPDDILGAALLAAYITRVHADYPFVHRKAIERMHMRRHDLPSSSPWLVKLHLIYGTGARHLQLSGRSIVSFDRTLPEAHFVAAARHLDAALEVRSAESIEILLLLVIYSLHSPSGPGAWQLTGMAIRLCVELGLHRGVRMVNDSNRLADQQRKRLFWAAIILERRVALTLGRPFSLADADIDVELPADVDDDLEDPAAIALAMTRRGLSTMSRHIHLARLQRLLSRAKACHSTSAPPTMDDILQVQLDLEHWRADVCNPHLRPDRDEPALLLAYYRALHIVLHAQIVRFDRQLTAVRQCAHAAGQICQLYKRIHQDSPAGFFLLEMHDVLVAGISLIYCLWTEPAGPCAPQILIDLGSCSTVLFLIAERWQSAKRYRDAFEVLVQATVEYKQRHTADPAAVPVPQETSNTPVQMGDGLQALLEPGLFGDDDTAWRRMLGELTGTATAGPDDWLFSFE